MAYLFHGARLKLMELSRMHCYFINVLGSTFLVVCYSLIYLKGAREGAKIQRIGSATMLSAVALVIAIGSHILTEAAIIDNYADILFQLGCPIIYLEAVRRFPSGPYYAWMILRHRRDASFTASKIVPGGSKEMNGAVVVFMSLIGALLCILVVLRLALIFVLLKK